MPTLSMQTGNTSHMGSIANNAERNVTNSSVVNLNPNPLSPGSQGSANEYSGGAQFTTDANITNGLTITSATFKMTAFGTYAAAGTGVSYLVSAHAADNGAALTATSGDLNITARPRTTAVSAKWSVTSVTVDIQYTIDITSVIQELVNRAGWVSGNRMIITIDTHADTELGEWQDWYGSGASRPVLDIVYPAAGATSLPPIRRGSSFRGLIVR